VNIKILSAANQDLIDGYYFYENQTQNIGSYFLNSLYSDIDSLAITAGVHEKHFDNYYRSLSKRFPFSIYYKIEDDYIKVYSILDNRKKPAWTRNKLKS